MKKKTSFLIWFSQRDENEILSLLKKLEIPIIEIDGEKNICENVDLLVNSL